MADDNIVSNITKIANRNHEVIYDTTKYLRLFTDTENKRHSYVTCYLLNFFILGFLIFWLKINRQCIIHFRLDIHKLNEILFLSSFFQDPCNGIKVSDNSLRTIIIYCRNIIPSLFRICKVTFYELVLQETSFQVVKVVWIINMSMYTLLI